MAASRFEVSAVVFRIASAACRAALNGSETDWAQA